MNNNEPPYIDVVVIGLNAEKYLEECLQSIGEADYPAEKIHIAYVDGGSHDGSISIAHRFSEVNVIKLDHPKPSPGRGRNSGFKNTSHPYIQFLDSDSYIHRNWFRHAIEHMDDSFGAIWGNLNEREPEQNIYHKVTDIDWKLIYGLNGWIDGEGETSGFGGNVLIRRKAMEEAGGRYDDTLIAGEEADLAYRIRSKGWRILKTDCDMASHDINMSSIRQYYRRAFRSGYGYGQIGFRYISSGQKNYAMRIFRMLASGLFPFLLIIFGFSIGYPILSMILALLIVLRPMRKVLTFKEKLNLSMKDSLIYCLHLSIIIFPQFFGLCRFILGHFFKKPIYNSSKSPQKDKT